MIIEVKQLVGFIEDHGLENYFIIYDMKEDIYLKTEFINGEYWYNCYTDQYSDYAFSSRDIKECLDYLNILYYDGEEYR